MLVAITSPYLDGTVGVPAEDIISISTNVSEITEILCVRGDREYVYHSDDSVIRVIRNVNKALACGR